MLCMDDMWSFEEGVLRHLPIADAMSLASTCKDLARVVLAHCRACRYLPLVSSDEISTVTNPNVFSSLESFRYLLLSSRMDVCKLRKLLGRWGHWKCCRISTKDHTRKALIMWLTRMQSVESFTLLIDQRDSFRMVKMKNALECFVRKNGGLRQLEIHGCVSPIVLAPFWRSPLEELHLTLQLGSCADLGWVVASMPETVEVLVVRNILTPRYIMTDPYFLDVLGRRGNLKAISLENCLPYMSCAAEQWNLVRSFCENTYAQHVAFSVLRGDCVNVLLKRGVKFVGACVIGVPRTFHDDWKKRIPASWNVHFV